MDCEQALILISAALDGEITPEEREQLNSHLDRCAECRAIADDFGLISAALTEEIEIPVGLTEQMRAAVKDTSQNRKRTFLHRYGSLAAMLAIVLSLGAIVVSGAGGRNDVALFSGMGSAKMDAAAPAEAAPMPVPSVAAETKGKPQELLTADSALFDAKAESEEMADGGYEQYGQVVEESLNNGSTAPGDAAGGCTVADPNAEAMNPPDHATIYTAMKLVLEDLKEKDGLDRPPVQTDYYYCVLERTADGKQEEETWLEYTGLSANGKYYTFYLNVRTLVKGSSPAEDAVKLTVINNFAVPREMDRVLREFDENRSPEHQKAYLKALAN